MVDLRTLSELDQEDSIFDREAATKKSTWVSVLVNISLTISQVSAGIISGSQGLISDGIHSLSDLIADFVVLVAAHHSQKEADHRHHYGHQRYENLASLVLGLLLFAVGIGMAWTAVIKLQSPESIPKVHIFALWVALGAIIAKEVLFRYMLAVAERVRSSMLAANAWHARSDAASSLVVSVGIVGNLLGLTLLDPIAAIVVGFMVGKMGWTFMWAAIHDLTDHAASEDLIKAIEDEIMATPGVLGFHQLKTRKTGDLVLADVHLEIDGGLTVKEGHEIARQAKLNVVSKLEVLYLMVHVDPVTRS